MFYRYDFNMPEVAQEWTACYEDVRMPGRWIYVNNGGAAEEIFFRFDPYRTEDGELSIQESDVDKINEERNAWLISPPIWLEKGNRYVLTYEIQLFGVSFPAETVLAMGLVTADSALDLFSFKPTSAIMIDVLEHMEWSVDDFQWPIRILPVTVDVDGFYCFGLKACNTVPIKFYWLTVVDH